MGCSYRTSNRDWLLLLWWYTYALITLQEILDQPFALNDFQRGSNNLEFLTKKRQQNINAETKKENAILRTNNMYHVSTPIYTTNHEYQCYKNVLTRQ